MNNALIPNETIYLAGFFIEAGRFLINVIFNIIIILILIRFLLQIARADFYNPMSQTIVKLTSPILRPFRKIIPGIGGMDLASIFLLILLTFIKSLLILAILSITKIQFHEILINSVFMILNTIIFVYIVGILIMVVASWFSSGRYHPVLALIDQLISPVINPIRRIMPSTHGIDFSPLVAMVILSIIQMALKYLNPYSGLAMVGLG